MTPQWERRLAREGLILAICLGIGFLLLPFVIWSDAPDVAVGKKYLMLLSVLFL